MSVMKFGNLASENGGPGHDWQYGHQELQSFSAVKKDDIHSLACQDFLCETGSSEIFLGKKI